MGDGNAVFTVQLVLSFRDLRGRCFPFPVSDPDSDIFIRQCHVIILTVYDDLCPDFKDFPHIGQIKHGLFQIRLHLRLAAGIHVQQDLSSRKADPVERKSVSLDVKRYG